MKKRQLNLSLILWRSLRYTWEGPQNLLGLALYRIMGKQILNISYDHGRTFLEVSHFGISLGSYIFWSRIPADNQTPDNRAHEYGHTLQSEIFGPLYLLLVGLPSLCRALYARHYARVHHTPWKQYYLGYPERWASRLGKDFRPSA